MVFNLGLAKDGLGVPKNNEQNLVISMKNYSCSIIHYLKGPHENRIKNKNRLIYSKKVDNHYSYRRRSVFRTPYRSFARPIITLCITCVSYRYTIPMVYIIRYIKCIIYSVSRSRPHARLCHITRTYTYISTN